MSLITIHLGQRAPKAYERDTDPHNPTLAERQPGEVKCRLALRFPAETPMRARMREAEMAWRLLDWDAKPAWIAGVCPRTVQALAASMEIDEIRDWEPDEQDGADANAALRKAEGGALPAHLQEGGEA